jgi:zinc transporter ZupT
VERVFTGTVTSVGGLLAFEGVVHALDDQFGDLQVGFFEMIDTTEARMLLSDEEAADKILLGKKAKSK